MRYLLACVLTLVMIAAGTQETQAQTCVAGAVRLDDYVGTYINQDSPMRLDVSPCGGLYLVWDNQYGRHRALYGATQRFPSGGVVAVGIQADPFGVFLDDGRALGVEPAEPGWIKLLTISPYLTEARSYRLEKLR